MRLFEFEAKEAFQRAGLPLPRGQVVEDPDAAGKIAQTLAGPVVLKVQILAGGRGKAGGIKFAKTPTEARKLAKQMLELTIQGHPVRRILVEERLDISQEIYLGITVDRSQRRPIAICSAMGGIDIEEVAKKHPEKMARFAVDPLFGFREFEARRLCKAAGFEGRALLQIAGMLMRLWQVFVENDAELTEINPLIVTKDDRYIAADARLNVDESSLYRHRALAERVKTGITEQTDLERRAQELGMTYVELQGNIGIIGNGAGLVMATMDAVHYYGGVPANFLDVGGGATADRMVQALNIVISQSDVKVVFINILGGITRCDEMARGIVEARSSLPRLVPIVIRMIGTREKEGAAILNAAGIPFLNSMDEAGRLAVEKAKEAS